MVTTSYGQIRGIDMGSYTVYKGIPYAKPPVGDRRWRAPERCDPWDGIWEANAFASKCFQDETYYGFFEKEFYSNPDFLPSASEDCLYLNIWVPNGDQKDLPVAFWIHGGGFGGGWGSELEFDGASYCSRGVILVTINYRVNFYGFLAHPWLNEENEKQISGNYGILDQIAALTWVYENIRSFGGDRNNITVFGQSAGCMSAQVLVSSELTGNMIAKAIFQSGAVYRNDFLFTPTLEEEMACGEEFVSIAGAKNLEALRALTPEKIAFAREQFSAAAWKKGRGILIVPNADGYVLKEPVTACFDKGAVKNIPYMIGSVAEELGLNPGEGRNGVKSAFYHDAIAMSQHLESQGKSPAYVYYFTHPLPGDDNGAFHSAELWYMFGTLDRSWRPMTDKDRRLSEEMLDCWTHFMKAGVPTPENTWRACTESDPYVKIFR